MECEPTDLEDLEAAVELLESPSFIARVSNVVGTPVEYVIRKLPQGAGTKITQVVHESLRAALDVAVGTLGRGGLRRPRRRFHTTLAGLAGAGGGAFGLPALGVELPVTTTVILRSIAEIARDEGEDLSDPAVRLACLEVFAMGGPSKSDDASESGYFAVRAALARAVSEAARYVAQRSVVEPGAPVLVRLLAQIAARFNTVVAEKIMAQGVPVIGALGGASINVMFSEHFQAMARGHFVVRRLERAYGPDEVRRMYEQLRAGGS